MSNIKNTIYTDKDTIALRWVEFLKDYENLDNLDLTKLAFHTYLIDQLAQSTSDLMFFSSMNYRNNFQIVSSLNEAVNNNAKYLGYTPELASPATAITLIGVPNNFTTNVAFTLQQYHRFFANDIQYVLNYNINFSIQNGIITVQAVNDSFSFLVPFQIRNGVIYFTAAVTQMEIEDEVTPLTSSLISQQHYTVRTSNADYLYKLEVLVDEEDQFGNVTRYEYSKADGLYSMGSEDRKYLLRIIDTNDFELTFGNGVFGKQLPAGSIINIRKYTTKGKKGQVIAGAITSLDPVYVTINNRSAVIAMTANNLFDAKGGRNLETKDETRENSIRVFRSKLALTSNPDYEDYVNLKGVSSIKYAKPILKRSDLKANEMNLFNVLQMSNEIIPTNSLTQTLPVTTTYYNPYQVFTSGALQYYCPFAIDINVSNKEVSYIYFIEEIRALPDINIFDLINYPIAFEQVEVKTNATKTLIDIIMKYNAADPSKVNKNKLNGTLKFKFLDGTVSNPIAFTNNPATNEITVSYPTANIRDGQADFIFEIYLGIKKIGEGGPNLILKHRLDTRMLSNFKYTNKTKSTIDIYDIPVIEKTWYDSLSANDKINFDFSVLQTFIIETDMSKTRAFNMFINFKFVKTIGAITNYSYNTPKYTVLNIVKTLPTNPASGDLYLIADDAVILQKFKNYVAIYNGTTWEYIPPVPNDILLDLTSGNTLTYTSTRWYVMNYNVNLPVNVTVFINPTSSYDKASIETAVRSSIFEQLEDNFGPDSNILRADINRAIEDLMEEYKIMYYEVGEFESDIIFNYNISKDLTTQQLIEYVPEYIHVKEKDINVNVVLLTYNKRF